MGSGKSTVAKILEIDYEFTRLRISGKMREIAEELSLEPTRDFLQGIGAFMRQFDEDVWVRYVAKLAMKSNKSVVIDDIRKINEIDYLKPLGFKFIRINSPSKDRKERIENRTSQRISESDWERWGRHSTEIEVLNLPVDYEIENKSDMAELKTKMRDLVTLELKNTISNPDL